jgi:predicted RNA-binding protein associated with RNAse of E/G family
MITVIKADHLGQEKWRYTGEVVDRGPNWIQIQAFFNGDEGDDGFVVWRRGDRFVEWYYTDRWYNVFEVHEVTDDRLKGWYCNITRPTIITDDTITWPDLELDLWISPAGTVLLLDEDDFAAVPLDAETRTNALRAVEALRSMVEHRDAPFDQITDQFG